MTLLDKINSINKPQVPPLAYGQAKNMEELKKQLLCMYSMDKSIVLQWHRLLLDYVNMDFPMLAIRGYNSFKKEKYNCLRRGFLTETEEFSYFYTDNYFAAYFLKMCMDGYVPDLSEFYELMTTRQFPSRFGQITSQEKELMAIKQGKDPGINSAGYKLAHIIPVGKEYVIEGSEMGLQEILTRFFPLGQRSEWTLYSDNFGTYHMRKLHETNSAIKKIAVAHFLRFVHPFNYFICPKQKCEINNKCNDIAEYQPLLDIMHDYMLQTYGEAYKEFLNYISVGNKYGNDMYQGDPGLKVLYTRGLEDAPEGNKWLLKQVLSGADYDTIIKNWPKSNDVVGSFIENKYFDATPVAKQTTPVHTNPKEDSASSCHHWTYYENEFCVRMVFYNFVCTSFHDVSEVVSKIYSHLHGAIKEASIRMKLSNIKYLLDEEKISSYMPDSSLFKVSKQCRKAFYKVYEEYKNNGGFIADPTQPFTPDTPPAPKPTALPPPPPPTKQQTFKIKVTEDGVVRYYKHDTKNSGKNLIEGKFSYMLATPLYEIESKLRANELRKQYPNATVEVVNNVTE